MEQEILEVICNCRCSGDKVALATVIHTLGSTPRKAGSKMVVKRDGKTIGTIGGGCSEAEVRLQCLQALDSGAASVCRVDMTNDIAAQEGMVCGGVMDVLIQVV